MTPPVVSVVIPMRNEERSIEECIRTFDAQDHPHEALDVIVVDGMSDDSSRATVERLAAQRPWLRCIDNPDRIASAAFNRGIEAARGEVVCIVSSHGAVGPDFVSRSVQVLDETGAAGVGGRLEHVAEGATGRAIALAMTSPFGMASPFRYSNQRREVDTVGHPAYRRSVLATIGPFDESLDRNSDYELNQRIRDAGHTLIFEPTIVTTYHPRPSLQQLGRQFHDYGRWKAKIARRQPSTLRARHGVAPAFVALLASLPVLVRFRSGRHLAAAGLIGYGCVLAAAWARNRPGREGADPVTFLLAFPTMHVSWGSGFWRGLVERES